MNSAETSYVVVGHTTRDLVEGGWRLGGSVVYCAFAAQRLGLSTTIVTAHEDDLPTDEAFHGATCRKIASRATTTFRNVDRNGKRVQHLIDRAEPLVAAPDEAFSGTSDILHLAPVFQEIDARFVRDFSAGLCCATLQGWMRGVDEAGCVVPRRHADWIDLLARLDIAVYSSDDIKQYIKWEEEIHKAVRISVRTLGDKGCVVFDRNHEWVLATDPLETDDTTGAGDMFATAFFAEYFRTGDPVRAGRFANRFTHDVLAEATFRDAVSPIRRSAASY